MQALLSADSDDALHTIRVYHSEGVPRLTRWQTKLVEKLNQDADNFEESRDEELPQILNEVLGSDFTGEPGSSLRVLQERLFEVVTDKGEVDGSVQWVGTRDFLQEAEVAAGMVQSMLAENADLEPSDIGLLIPDSSSTPRRWRMRVLSVASCFRGCPRNAGAVISAAKLSFIFCIAGKSLRPPWLWLCACHRH